MKKEESQKYLDMPTIKSVSMGYEKLNLKIIDKENDYVIFEHEDRVHKLKLKINNEGIRYFVYTGNVVPIYE